MKKHTKLYTLIFIILIILIIILTLFLTKNLVYNKSNKDSNNNNIPDITPVAKYNNPVIPEGFKKVETDSASWTLDEEGNPKGWNDGLVIEDENGNQFVWVPYDDSYQKQLEKLKDFLTDEFEVIRQIKKYGGFYIARYEAGLPTQLQNRINNITIEENDIIDIPVSKKGIIPWNYITFQKADASAKEMYTDNKYVNSSLLNIKQRLIVDTWIKQNGYNFNNLKTLGNYSNSNFNFSGYVSNDLGKNYKMVTNSQKNSDNIIISTGACEEFIVNNIYDYFGNVTESTRSSGLNNNFICYSCGGFYDNSDKGEDFTHAWANSKTGFRVYLIIL